jgi:hypothetical protein
MQKKTRHDNVYHQTNTTPNQENSFFEEDMTTVKIIWNWTMLMVY